MAEETSAPLIEHVRGLIEDWKRGDLDAVLARVHDDVVYHYHVGTRPVVGKARLRRLLESLAGRQKQIRWRIVHHAQNGRTLLVEGLDDYVNDEGRRVRTPYMGIFEFDAGLIRGWRDYLDLAVLQRLEAGEEMPEGFDALIDRS